MDTKKRERGEEEPERYSPSNPAFRVLEDNYDLTKKIGEGTFGKVHLGREKRENGRQVAVKQLKVGKSDKDDDINNAHVRREIRILQFLAGKENIVRLLEVARDKRRSLYLVMECADHDLGGLLQSRGHQGLLELGTVKSYIFQLFRALAVCHSHGIVHRDIKPANILLAPGGVIKLADFGLARFLNDPADRLNSLKQEHTNMVETIWYRAPELLYGSTAYTPGVDVWSAAVCFVELLLGVCPFRGAENEAETKAMLCAGKSSQLPRIYAYCGTPVTEGWPKYLHQAIRESFETRVPRFLTQRISREIKRKDFCTALGLELVDKLLVLNPQDRISADAVLQHAYWQGEIPRAYSPAQIPVFGKSFFDKRSPRPPRAPAAEQQQQPKKQ